MWRKLQWFYCSRNVHLIHKKDHLFKSSQLWAFVLFTGFILGNVLTCLQALELQAIQIVSSGVLSSWVHMSLLTKILRVLSQFSTPESWHLSWHSMVLSSHTLSPKQWYFLSFKIICVSQISRVYCGFVVLGFFFFFPKRELLVSSIFPSIFPHLGSGWVLPWLQADKEGMLWLFRQRYSSDLKLQGNFS